MTFYEKVLKEFEENDAYLLCLGSKKFKKAWAFKTKRLKIARKLKKFLQTINQLQYFKGYEDYLSTPMISLITNGDLDYQRQIRLEFLSWCVLNNLDL